MNTAIPDTGPVVTTERTNPVLRFPTQRLLRRQSGCVSEHARLAIQVQVDDHGMYEAVDEFQRIVVHGRHARELLINLSHALTELYGDNVPDLQVNLC